MLLMALLSISSASYACSNEPGAPDNSSTSDNREKVSKIVGAAINISPDLARIIVAYAAEKVDNAHSYANIH